MHLRRLVCIGLLVAALAACGQKAAPQPTPTPTPTRAQPTWTPVPIPTAGQQEVEMGFTAEGWPYRGNPNAEVTLWEFSEFQ